MEWVFACAENQLMRPVAQLINCAGHQSQVGGLRCRLEALIFRSRPDLFLVLTRVGRALGEWARSSSAEHPPPEVNEGPREPTSRDWGRKLPRIELELDS